MRWSVLLLLIPLAGCSESQTTDAIDHFVPNPTWEIVWAFPHNASCTAKVCEALDLKISTRLANDTDADDVRFRVVGGSEAVLSRTIDGPSRYASFKSYWVTVWFEQSVIWEDRQVDIQVRNEDRWVTWDKANITPWLSRDQA